MIIAIKENKKEGETVYGCSVIPRNRREDPGQDETSVYTVHSEVPGAH